MSNAEASLFDLCQIGTLPITAKDLAPHIRKDSMLAKVIYYANEGWPSSMDRSDPFYPYFCKKKEQSVECVHCGYQTSHQCSHVPKRIRKNLEICAISSQTL